MALRQRRAGGPSYGDDGPSKPSVVESLKAFDINPKTLDDFKERTGSGAAVSVISLTVIVLLILSELRSYFTPVVSDHLYVDTARGERIRINVNITFPSMPCAGLNLVAMDVAGEQQIDVVDNVVKTRLSLDGRRRLGSELDEAGVAAALGGRGYRGGRGGRGAKCGPCFPSLDPELLSRNVEVKSVNERNCCNSCADVKKVYSDLGSRVSLGDGREQAVHWEEHPVCQHEAVLLDPSRLASIKEGCNLFGFLEVNKVAGNFHVAPGKAFQSAQGQLVHEFKPFDTHTYNVSHEIHSLSFGAHYPNRVNPLDDAMAILRNGSGVFQYFVKVVPTQYRYATGSSVESCQYSVTDQFKSAHDPSKGFVLPGVFFIYDISPIMVKFTEKRPSRSYFLTSLCAIVGGVFTVAGIVDGILYQGGALFSKRSDGMLDR